MRQNGPLMYSIAHNDCASNNNKLMYSCMCNTEHFLEKTVLFELFAAHILSLSLSFSHIKCPFTFLSFLSLWWIATVDVVVELGPKDLFTTTKGSRLKK